MSPDSVSSSRRKEEEYQGIATMKDDEIETEDKTEWFGGPADRYKPPLSV